MKLEQIQPLQLHTVWPQVLPGLQKVQAKAQPEWWPEDVFTVLKLGHATLYMCYVDGAYVGFFVLCPKQDEYSGKRSLLVWIAYSNRLFDATNEGLQEIYKIAKSSGYASVCLYSPRLAWARRLAREGFRISEVKFEKVL